MKTFLLMVAMLSFTGGLIWPSRPRCTLRSLRLSSGDLQVFIVRINSFPRLLVHSLTPSLHKLFTHSLLTLNLLTQSINHSLTQLITHLLTHSINHSLTHSLTHSPGADGCRTKGEAKAARVGSVGCEKCSDISLARASTRRH